jgi:ankyrin repeat protein
VALLGVAPVGRADDNLPPPKAPPIIQAIQDGNLAQVKALLERQPSLANYVNTQPPHKGALDGRSALHWAAVQGRADIAGLLLAHNADPNVKDFLGDTPLHLAARRGDTATARLLLAHRADVHARGVSRDTPLHNAAAAGDRELMGLLLDRGARVDVADERGFTPLHRALWKDYRGARNPARQKAAVELLLAEGAFADPLIEAALGRVKRVRQFLAADPSRLSHRDNWERTLLHWAAMAGQREVVALLLDQGADPNAADYMGETPLHLAISCGQAAVVQLLVQRADPNRYNGAGWTALACAQGGREWLCVALIVAYRPDARSEGRSESASISQTPCD